MRLGDDKVERQRCTCAAYGTSTPFGRPPAKIDPRGASGLAPLGSPCMHPFGHTSIGAALTVRPVLSAEDMDKVLAKSVAARPPQQQ
jgi:hypothetical protein